MKSFKFFALVASLFISANIMANNYISLSSVTNIEYGNIKEIVKFDEQSQKPIQKTAYTYDNSGVITEKAVYKWNTEQGWEGKQKLSYTYDEQKQPSTISLYKWDRKSLNWLETAEEIK